LSPEEMQRIHSRAYPTTAPALELFPAFRPRR
jgi:hypothetical protein